MFDNTLLQEKQERYGFPGPALEFLNTRKI